MSESDESFESAGQPIIYPCDSSHSETAASMGRNMNKCREELPISEKAICPFNDKHESFAPEMDCHKLVCPYTSQKYKIQQDSSNRCDGDGESHKSQEFGSFSSATTFKFSSSEATGCESGLDVVGGIRNYDSFISEADETGAMAHDDPELASNGKNQQPQKTLSGDCLRMTENGVASSIVGLESTNDNKSIEKRLRQLESDTVCSETNSCMGNSENFGKEERFDYTKYIPSEDLKEDFLKSIGKPTNGQVCETKCQFSSHPFVIQQWPQDYHFPAQFQNHNGYQSTGVQQTFLSFSNTYNMIPAVSSGQAAYTCTYGFHNQTPGPGFLQSPCQELGYDYCGYPAGRPSHYRSFYRRRNTNNPFRYSNHKSYNSHTYEKHTESFFNDFNQQEINLGESCYLSKLNNTETNGDISTSLSLCMKSGCDNQNKPTSSREVNKNNFYFEESQIGDVDVQEHFVDIGEVPEKQEMEVSGGSGVVNLHSSQDDIKKSENEKQIRKMKKKLAEISGLEEKYRKGANLDCDQLKKLKRKSEFEDQLQSLNLS